MTEKLQDLAWSILPKEFKEEVKKIYNADDPLVSPEENEIFDYIFGEHNLTSNAEGEEMLTVSRKKVQEFYAKCKEVTKNPYSYPDYSHESALSRMTLLDILFGSKCLSDELNEDNFTKSEPKKKSVSEISEEISDRVAKIIKAEFDKIEPNPAEPKFKVGDIASYVCSPTLKHKCTVTKVMQNEYSDKYEYNVMFEWGKPRMWIPESDLEPYTAPKASTCTETCTNDCLSQCKSQDFDTILKDGFRNERRLNIAAMAMQGILSNPCGFTLDGEDQDKTPENVAEMAFLFADALIAEAEKGGAE